MERGGYLISLLLVMGLIVSGVVMPKEVQAGEIQIIRWQNAISSTSQGKNYILSQRLSSLDNLTFNAPSGFDIIGIRVGSVVDAWYSIPHLTMYYQDGQRIGDAYPGQYRAITPCKSFRIRSDRESDTFTYADVFLKRTEPTSTSISQVDRNLIIDGVTGSAVMTNITNKINDQTNTLTNTLGNISSLVNDINIAIDGNVPPPFIHNLKGKNNATATSNGKFTIVIEAQNTTEYRARYDNSAWTGWGSNKEIEITGIPKGVKTITVEAKNDKDETYSKEMTVFSL